MYLDDIRLALFLRYSYAKLTLIFCINFTFKAEVTVWRTLYTTQNRDKIQIISYSVFVQQWFYNLCMYICILCETTANKAKC